MRCRRDEVSEVFNAPLLDLVHHAATVHRMHNDPSMVRTLGAARHSRRGLRRRAGAPAAP
jgi:hypothetical protein